MSIYRKLIVISLILTTIVVVFGAYVRLADAGLGCPDWPGCFGQLTPTQAADQIWAAYVADPQGHVSMPKAWKEMIHRYLATGLGLMIIAIAVIAWMRRRNPAAAPIAATALLAVVIFQGLLGKWTVTMLLNPAIVTAHLIGGMTTLAIIAWLAMRAYQVTQVRAPSSMVLFARAAFVLLAAQIILGGWVSTNYAALACTDFPTCNGSWWPQADYANAVQIFRELGLTPEGDLLPFDALVAMHWMHRVGAVIAGVALIALGWSLRRYEALRSVGMVLIVATLLQIVIGIANVVMNLPLLLAAAHNAGAALLVVIMVCINYQLSRARFAAAVGEGENGRGEHQKSYA